MSQGHEAFHDLHSHWNSVPELLRRFYCRSGFKLKIAPCHSACISKASVKSAAIRCHDQDILGQIFRAKKIVVSLYATTSEQEAACWIDGFDKLTFFLVQSQTLNLSEVCCKFKSGINFKRSSLTCCLGVFICTSFCELKLCLKLRLSTDFVWLRDPLQNALLRV